MPSAGADSPDATLLTVAAFTGLRLGELRALRWADIDFGDQLVHVRRAYVRGVMKLPKSGKVRSVPLIDQAAVVLDAVSRREHFTAPDDLAFVNSLARTLDDSKLRRRFRKALAAAELKPGRLHDLPYSYCSLAVRCYWLDEVGVYADHSNIETTMLYVHHVPANDAADRLSAVVSTAVSVQTGCEPIRQASPLAA